MCWLLASYDNVGGEFLPGSRVLQLHLSRICSCQRHKEDFIRETNVVCFAHGFLHLGFGRGKLSDTRLTLQCTLVFTHRALQCILVFTHRALLPCGGYKSTGMDC